MSTFKVHSIDSAPSGSRDTLQAIHQTMGFVPNMLGVFADSPAVLQGSFALFGALGKGSLSPIEQQVVAITISRENSCHYCVAAHSTFATMASIPPDVLTATRSGASLPDAKLETLRYTTLKLLFSRGWLSQADQHNFFAAGYSKAQLLEVIAWIGLKTLTNYINHIGNTPVDEAFGTQTWLREEAA